MRLLLVGTLLGLSLMASVLDAQAQSRTARGAVIGGMTGAAIGGLAGGGRGAAVGTLAGMGVGAVMGRAEDRRRNNHYWISGRCWIRLNNGEFHPVANRYC
jgi:outer membrane lipoprotein SlyB